MQAITPRALALQLAGREFMALCRSVLLVSALLVISAPACLGQEQPPAAPLVVFFYQEGCPDCVKIGEILDALETELPAGAIVRHEIGEPQSRSLFRKLQKAYGIDVSTVPVVFVGDRFVIGASQARELELTDAIGDCITGACTSPMDRVPPDVFPWRDALELGLLALLVVLLVLLQLS